MHLLAAVDMFKGTFDVRPQKMISGPNGHRPLDFDLRQSSRTVCVTEMKRD